MQYQKITIAQITQHQKRGQKPISKYERMWKTVPWSSTKYYTTFGQQCVPNCNLLGYNKV